MKEGTVKEIIGVVIDVDFAGGELPAINNALSAATGLRLKQIPLTPERVLRGLLEKG